MRARGFLAVCASVLLLVSGPSIAGATTLDFSNLVGANGDPYAGSSQNGFNILPFGGLLFEAHAFGNPVPSIYAGPIGSPSISAVQVTMAGGAFFTFDSVDLACNDGTGCDFLVEGFFLGTSPFSFADVVPAGPPFAFVTELNAFSATLVDELRILIAPGDGTSSMNIDNIVVSEAAAPIPEPATIVLLGSGLLGLASRRRRAA